MKRSLTVMVWAVLLALVFSWNTALADSPEPDSASAANNAFAFDLFNKVSAGDNGKNVFLSPYSLSAALSMTYAGAREKTAHEMATVLHYGAVGEKVHQDFNTMTQEVLKSEKQGIRIHIANALWGQDSQGFQKDFLDLVGKYYQGGFNQVDFAGQTEKARQAINQWVLKNTADKIRELLVPGNIGPDTQLVLTNAIYFKGDWASKFEKDLTKKMPFHTGSGKSMDVEMMFHDGSFLHGETSDGVQVLELFYQGEDLSMVILLPRNGIQDLEKTIQPASFEAWISGLEKKEVKVFLPKFKFQSRYSLKNALQFLGMNEAFEGNADFSGMTGGKGGLAISEVIHQANIEVNEEGTEAAAATAVIMGKSLSMPEVFKADHPFIFVIRHRPTNAILFMGSVLELDEAK
ncbi:MAG: serpin family protein [Proteobacteria bacterium]|nr:serpin family protein [Pseudomonadota bacterium]MBU4470644.1 serpin family protein [Pseudomonadota bacterium]MCG2753369.1 serpin family protein [Desulfobacteraceae bacterium]